MARVLVFRHSAAVPPGRLADVLKEAGVDLEVVALDAGEPVPAGGDWDGVVSLGGEMGAYEEDAHPWLAAEKRFLAGRADAGVPVLGICLGSQVLAEALGGRAHPSDRGPEIGVMAPLLTDEGRGDPVAAGLAGPVPVWHFDTFDLPPGAVLLARTEGFPHAFRAGTALGIQSHPEATPEIVAAWAADPRAAARLADAGLDPDGLVADVEAHVAATSAVAAEIFGRWAASL